MLPSINQKRGFNTSIEEMPGLDGNIKEIEDEEF